MPTVAEQLRQARETRQLSVEQVAETTKMRTDHLRALEEGDYSVFSAPVYIRGFVRTLSTMFKLDVAQMMATLDAELGQTTKFSEPPPLTGPPRGVLDFLMLQLSKLDWRKSVVGAGGIAVVALAALGYFAWRHYRTADPLRGLKPGLYHSTQHVSGETLPLPAPPSRK